MNITAFDLDRRIQNPNEALLNFLNQFIIRYSIQRYNINRNFIVDRVDILMIMDNLCP